MHAASLFLSSALCLRRSVARQARQYLYFCTSTASKVSTEIRRLARVSRRQDDVKLVEQRLVLHDGFSETAAQVLHLSFIFGRAVLQRALQRLHLTSQPRNFRPE